MFTARFRVHKHTLAASHIREYPRSTAQDQEDALQLAIKQYVPTQAPTQGSIGITVIGAHANGFPKELYEPLWDDHFDRLATDGVYIRSVWNADVANQGQSGVLNEDKLGNDPSWIDHPRDLFLMINHFREHMQRPIVGIAHSMGGNHLVNLALMHARLFSSLILIEPVIQRMVLITDTYIPAKVSALRRDRWPNREAANTAFLRSKFYQAWDPRMLEKWIEHGLRELPTALCPVDEQSSREISRDGIKVAGAGEANRGNPDPWTKPNPHTHPDFDPTLRPAVPFYRPEIVSTFRQLPYLKPSTLYLFGDLSDLSYPMARADKMATTGIGPGGSGGAKKDRVAQHVFKNRGHMVPFEIVKDTADICTSWTISELQRWREYEKEETTSWAKVPKHLKNQMSEQYRKLVVSDWAKEFPDRRLHDIAKL